MCSLYPKMFIFSLMLVCGPVSMFSFVCICICSFFVKIKMFMCVLFVHPHTFGYVVYLRYVMYHVILQLKM